MKTLLFIRAYLEGDFDLLELKLKAVLIIWSIVLLAIIIDLISGLKKAKQRGELRTSYGLQRTVRKIVTYFGALTFALMIDIIASYFVSFPVFTSIMAIFLIVIEGTSVYEKADEKQRKKMADEATTLITLLEHKDDILNGIAEVLKTKLKQDKENENTN